MTLSAPDLAIWRTAPYSVFFYAAIHNPAIVFQAQVNMASVTYPANQLTFDTVTTGSYIDIIEEQLLLLGTSAGASDLGRVCVHGDINRVVATSSTINISRSSQGRHDGEIDISDNMFITVLDLRILRAAPPWIDAITDPDNPTTYKDGIIGFDSFNTLQPVVIMGGDRLKIVETVSDTATFDFDCSASYTTDPAADGTFTPQWYVQDGNIISGGVNSTVITVEYPVAAHDRYIQCQITDNVGHVVIGYRLVMVKDKANADLISKFTIPNGTKRADGHTISLQVSSAIPFGTYPDGTEFLLRQRERYGTAQTGTLPVGQSDAEDMWFSGWLQSEQNTGEASKKGFIARSVLTLLDAAGRLKTLPGFPQVVDRKASPGRWEQMQAANIDRYVYYLLRWHSNALTRCDFFWSGTLDTYGFSTLGSDGKSLWDQASERTQAITYALTCDKNGRLWMLPDPQLAPTAAQVSDFSLPIPARNTTPLLAILTSDWSSYRYAYTRPPRVHWNWGNAIQVTTVDVDSLSDIPTLFCVAPGLSPNQGLSEQTSGAQLAISQNELDCREGNRIAVRMNNVLGYLETDIRPGDAGYDPALMRYLSFTIDASTAGPRGRTFAAPNLLPIEVNYSYDAQKGLRKPTLTLEAEDPIGQVAVLDPQPQIGQNQIPPTYPPFTPPPLIDPNANILGSGTATLGFVADDGYFYYADIRPVTPIWYRIAISSLHSSPGTPDIFMINAFAPANSVLISDTKAYQFLAMGSTSRSLANQHTFTWATLYRSMQSERRVNGFFAVISYRQSVDGAEGTNVDASTDAGVTWTTHTSVFGTWGGAANADGYRPGCYVSPHSAGLVFASGYTGAGVTTGAIYQSTDYGATWSRLNSFTFYNLASDITIPYQDTGDGTLYHGGAQLVTGVVQYRLYKSTSSSQADISPTVAGTKYGPIAQFGVKTCDVDQNLVLCVGQDGAVGSPKRGVFLSRDRGATWTVLIAPSTSVVFTACSFAGNDPNTIWLWGGGILWVSYDGGLNFKDLSGNLSTFTSPSIGRIENIAGLN